MTDTSRAAHLRDVVARRGDPVVQLLVDFVLLQQEEIATLRGRVYQLEGSEFAVEAAVARAQADIAVLQSEVGTNPPPVHHPATHGVISFGTPTKRGNA